MRGGPARRARDEAQPLLQIEPVHLVDHAVDVETEARAVQLDLAIGGEHLVLGLAEPVLGGTGKPQSAMASRTSWLVGAGESAGLAPAPGEEAQGPRGGDRGIELAQRAGGGVARIGEGLAALFRLPLVERGEIGVAHIDLAANLEDIGHVAALQLAPECPRWCARWR